MRRTLLIALAALSSATLPGKTITHNVIDHDPEVSASSTVVPLWPQDDLASVTREIIVVDEPDDPNMIKCGVVRPSLTLYRPRRGTANGAALVIIPGGGYRRLYMTAGGYDFANFLVAHGYTVGLVKYRMTDPKQKLPELPLPIADSLRAVRLLRSLADSLKINPHWIGVVGTSAGGHAAAACAAFGDRGHPTSADPVERVSSRPDFVILHSAVISMEPARQPAANRIGLLGNHPSPEEIVRFSLEKQVGKDWPPTLVVAARDDTLTAGNSEPMIAAIRQAGRSVETLVYDEGGHAFSFHNLQGPRAGWPEKWLAWMQSQTTQSQP